MGMELRFGLRGEQLDRLTVCRQFGARQCDQRKDEGHAAAYQHRDHAYQKGTRTDSPRQRHVGTEPALQHVPDWRHQRVFLLDRGSSLSSAV